MENPLARTPIPLDRGLTLSPSPLSDRSDAVTRWQSLLDARLIGHVPPPAPHMTAIRDANDAPFRLPTAAHRAAIREDRA